MTPSERMSEIEGRLAKATPGPWSADDDCDVESDALPVDENGCGGDIASFPFGRFADADFTAHARQDITWLLDRVRELEKALAVPGSIESYIAERDHWKLKAQTAEALVACKEYSEDLLAQRAERAERALAEAMTKVKNLEEELKMYKIVKEVTEQND